MTEKIKKRILLVEDDALISELYETVFQKGGYEVKVAKDGEEALKVVESASFDLILLDIMLPKLTGIDVLKVFKGPNSKIMQVPVYLLTNLGEENITQEAFKLGADGYFLKAKYLPKELLAEIDKLLVSEVSEEEGTVVATPKESDEDVQKGIPLKF